MNTTRISNILSNNLCVSDMFIIVIYQRHENNFSTGDNSDVLYKIKIIFIKSFIICLKYLNFVVSHMKYNISNSVLEIDKLWYLKYHY